MTALPSDIQLTHGVMQHWSDADHGPAGGTGLFRGLLSGPARAADHVVVVGATTLELLVGLAGETEERGTRVTVVVRGLGDARRVADAFAGTERVQVVCGDLDDLVAEGTTADLVVALDGVERIASAESAPASWAERCAQVVSLVADGGTLVLGVENQLGAHRITAPGSRLVDAGDADWLPMAVDPSRPGSPSACLAALTDHLRPTALLSWYGGWSTPRVAVVGSPDGSEVDGVTAEVTAAYVLRDTLRHGHADPSRLMLPAAAAGALDTLASGWLVVAGRNAAAPPELPEPGALLLETPAGTASVRLDGTRVRVAEGDESGLTVDPGTAPVPLTVALLDQCARADLPAIRRTLREHRDWLAARATDGMLPVELSAAEYDTVVRVDDGFVPLVPGTEPVSTETVLWRSIDGLVASLRAGGFRHPWPAFSDDGVIATALGTMLGLDRPDDPAGRRAAREADATDDRQTLLARIERLEEANRANASRATWFERRLNERERELRRHHERQLDQVRGKEFEAEELRRQMQHLRNSPTFKLGRLAIAPLRGARAVARKLGM